jgi:hypothetical protein
MKFLTPLPFLAALLAAAVMPLSAQAPGADKFAAGQRKTFSTAGHSKAKGVSLAISYPDNWEATDAENPDVVQTITSARGFGMEVITVQAKSLGLPAGAQLKPADYAQHFGPAGLKAMVPAGAKLIAAKPATLLGQPGGMVEYSRGEQRGPKNFEYHVLTYAFVREGAMVQIQFQVGGVVGGGPPVAQRMKECKPLFEQILKSVK